jgi:hypothetical protein
VRRDSYRFRVVLASVLGVFLTAVLIGLAVGGTTHAAAQAVVFAFGAVMLGAAGFMLVFALRSRHTDEDWNVVVGYTALRGGAGVSAIWLGLGGGATAASVLVAFVVGFPMWAALMRRFRGVS